MSITGHDIDSSYIYSSMPIGLPVRSIKDLRTNLSRASYSARIWDFRTTSDLGTLRLAKKSSSDKKYFT